MPIETVIEKDKGVIIRTVAGEIIFEDIKASFEESLKHPDYEKKSPVLWDFRHADLVKINDEDLLKISGYYDNQMEIHAGFKGAFVVSDNFELGLLELYKVYAAYLPVDIEIFRNYEDAMEWVLDKD